MQSNARQNKAMPGSDKQEHIELGSRQDHSTNVRLLEKVLSQTSEFFKKSDYWKKVPPLAAQLPQTSDFSNKVRFPQTVLPQTAQLPRK